MSDITSKGFPDSKAPALVVSKINGMTLSEACPSDRAQKELCYVTYGDSDECQPYIARYFKCLSENGFDVTKYMHYSRKPQVSAKSAKAQVSDLGCHFKNTFETANVINGMPLRKAQQLYRQVLAKTRCIPFRRYNRKIGRTAQAKEWGLTKGRWPRKSVVAMLSLLKNAEANAIAKGLEPSKMVVKHVQVDQAPRRYRRTYRAHGSITPYIKSPCHVQLFMSEKAKSVPKPTSKPKKDE